jgi:hypothetical protein
MRFEEEVISILSVACPIDGYDERVSVTDTATARETMAALRLMQFDLMVTQTALQGEPVWELARKVRAMRPRMRWMLLAPDLTAREETQARSLGVTRIVDSALTYQDLIQMAGPTPAMLRISAPAISGNR